MTLKSLKNKTQKFTKIGEEGLSSDFKGEVETYIRTRPMLSTKSLASLIVPGLLVFVISCSKSESEDETAVTALAPTESGVQTTTETTINISGSLNVSGLGLTAIENKGVLAFSLVGGELKSAAREITVASDGSFTVPVDRSSGTAGKLKEQLAADPIPRSDASFLAGLSSFFGASEAEVTEFLSSKTDAELKSELTADIDYQVKVGSVTLLVAYDKSATGDKVAEANSFKFIGLPTASGKSLAAIDSQSIKGNLGLGSIALGDSDDAKSSLSATDALSVSAEAAETLADMSAALKSVKNSWMNASWEASPFFLWNGGQTLSSTLDTFSSPANSSYRGYGFYVGSQYEVATPFTFDDICGTGAKEVKFSPPTAVEVSQGSDSNGVLSNYVSLSAFTNASSSEQNQQDGKRVCSGSSFYARADGTNDFMLNFGTGGGIKGDIPAGLWTISYDSSELGRFDLASAKPVNSELKSKVFLPSVKFVKDGDNIVGGEVEFYMWNGTEYVKLTDLSPVTKLIGENGISLWSSTTQEVRAEMSIADGASKGVATFDEPVAASSVSQGAFYYNIGEQSYRIEFSSY